MQVGDEVWVKAKVTSIRPDGAMGARVGVGVRIAARVGSSYAGSSPVHAAVVDGVVLRVTQVPLEDVRPA